MMVVEGNAYFEGKLKKLCIGIEDGKIVAMKKILKGDPHMDFGEGLILPAGIDIHVHFREPGFTGKEDFATGTMSAAYGGIGTVVDMPNTNPPVASPSGLMEKLKLAQRKACVDFGLYAAITPEGDLPALSRMCTGFKLYLSGSTAAHAIAISDSATLKPLVGSAAGKVVAGHCEDETLFRKIIQKNLEQYLEARPGASESAAVEKFLALGGAGSRLHVCHVSAKESVGIIRDAKNRIVNKSMQIELTCEATPHHMLLNSKFDLGAFGKVNPPLRSGGDQVALWNAFNDGTVDILASDHAPHTFGEKQEFETAPSGVPGVETMLPLMLLQAQKGRIGLDRLVNAVSEKPAELFGLNKGKIAIGKDADLIAVDPRCTEKISAKRLHSKCGWTPYEKFEAMFPVMTMVRGEEIISGGEFVGKHGFGMYISQGGA